MAKVRIERDTFGNIEVAADRLWGAQTQRSLLNFRFPGETMPLAVFGRWPLLQELAASAVGRSVLEIARAEVSRLAIYGMGEEAGARWPQSFGAGAPAPRYLRLSTAEERRAHAES